MALFIQSFWYSNNYINTSKLVDLLVVFYKVGR